MTATEIDTDGQTNRISADARVVAAPDHDAVEELIAEDFERYAEERGLASTAVSRATPSPMLRRAVLYDAVGAEEDGVARVAG